MRPTLAPENHEGPVLPTGPFVFLGIKRET